MMINKTNKITLTCVIKKGEGMKKMTSLILLTLFALPISGNAADAKKVANGKFLFEDWGCKSCHSINGKYNQDPTKGPDLTGVFKRRNAEWIKKFTKDPQAMIDSGDKDAVELHKKYGTVMKKFKMSDAEWNDIFEFLKS